MNIQKITNLYLNEKHTIQEVADELGLSFWAVYNVMKKNNIPRRGCREANYVTYDRYKPRFFIKEKLDFTEELLKIAGIMLYWAEGAKEGDIVDLANSDPRMIKIFLRFLREVCGIAEDRIRVYLYAFEDQNILELKRYWSKITRIPLAQFTKPYVRKQRYGKKDRRMPFGLIHIRYNDKRLFTEIKAWLKEYIDLFKSGEMPEQPNGPDCVKRSATEKSVV
ncbi:MAG: hypothetical protein WBC74_03635 [Candidatus Omnitrophota bacterium]